MNNNLITLFDVSKVYKIGRAEVVALKGVNLTIKKEEFLAIVGPSGAGKTTLLHVIGGLLPPTEGKVLFKGEDIYGKSDRWRCRWRINSVGFIFQFYHLIEELTVLENVALPSFLISSSKTAFKKAENLLKYLKIEKKAKNFPSELSGGEKQKVAIARALINEPELLLCDEPTGNLDKEAKEIVFDLLEFFNKEKKKTILLVTHNVELAKKAERVIYIKEGGLIQKG